MPTCARSSLTLQLKMGKQMLCRRKTWPSSTKLSFYVVADVANLPQDHNCYPM